MKINAIFTCAMLVLFTVILIPMADAANESQVNQSEQQTFGFQPPQQPSQFLPPTSVGATELSAIQSEQQSLGFQPPQQPSQFLPPTSVRATGSANVAGPGSGKNSIQTPSDSTLLPSLAAAGGRIIFESNRSTFYNLYAMNADGTGVSRLTSTVGTDGLPSPSHDGNKIAFESSRDLTSWQIYVMNADGTGQTRLTSTSGVGWSSHLVSRKFKDCLYLQPEWHL